MLEIGNRQHRSGAAYPHEGLDDVHDAAQEMRPAGQGGGAHRAQDRAGGYGHVDGVVEALVDGAVRVEDGEQVVAHKHLEHGGREVEVDRRVGLRAGAVEVEAESAVALGHAALDGKRSHLAVAAVVDEVGENLR